MRIRCKVRRWTLAGGLAVAGLTGALPSAMGASLVINANASDPAPRAAWEAIIADFRLENADIEVKFNNFDHESYKKAIRNWLTGAPPDVAFWFAGNRMRSFVKAGLLADVSALFTEATRLDLHASTVDLVSVGGKQYGVPYGYYQIGFYYRTDLFERAQVTAPPLDWGGLLDTCRRLKAAGVDPFVVGSKDLWPTAAWFDYLDLRLNGRDFHLDLAKGAVPFTDARVRDVFARWRELIELGCFNKNHVADGWQESQALLYQGRAAMMLIGNYIAPNFPADIRPRMAFAPFPRLRADVGAFEEAPTNSLHIPAQARNKKDALRFLAFVLRADVQEKLDRALLLLPVNRNAHPANDRFLQAGEKLLRQADGLTQYFDRDADEDFALAAMKGFQEFMVNPDRLDAILANIEAARNRVYRNN